MNDKLNQLTEKLYQEGVDKGKQEADRLIFEAQKEADGIILEAKQQAEMLLKQSEKQSLDMQNNMQTELKITSRQMLATTRQRVEEVIAMQVFKPLMKSALEKEAFVKELIVKALEMFAKGESTADLNLLLPEDYKSKFEDFLKNIVSEQMSANIEVVYESNLKSGFKIENKGEAYALSFTDEDFYALFSYYAKPKLRELLFGDVKSNA